MYVWIVKQVLDCEPQPLKGFPSLEYAKQYVSSIIENEIWEYTNDIWFYGTYKENDLEIERIEVLL